ncbi:MAG: hypothetical protein HYZ49_20850 [Chloroflexi bacterium]|nr:hypothetical protein [Chloroflexota bacterium]
MSRLASIQRAASSPARIPFIIIVVAVAALAVWFLWPSPVEFPMDDTYIHFVYAQNLVEHRTLMFNSPSETGVGTTSLLWVSLIAGGWALGVPMALTTKALGLASLAVVGVAVYLLLSPAWKSLPALITALLIVLSGHMIWFALSGMETVMFLALALLALLAYRSEHWVWLGVLLGLLPLTRPEGLALAAAIGVVELWRHKRLTRGLLIAAGLCLILCAPWFAYLLWRTGHILPTSGLGRQATIQLGLSLVLERSGALAVLGRIPGLIYVSLWIVYLFEFVLGGMALPPPHISIGGQVGNANYTVSVWAIVGLVTVIVPLLWRAGRKVAAHPKWPGWIQDEARRPLIVFLIWLILHNLSYIFFLPIPGTASRYGAINHLALWLGLTWGLLSFVGSRRWLWLAAGLALIATANTMYWNDVYDANLDHMQRVRIRSAALLRERFLAEQCAAFDIGALRYYSRRPLVDLGGLIDPALGEWFRAGELDRYLMERGVTCVFLPGRAGAVSEGWFDFAAYMGLGTSPLFSTCQLEVIEIDYDRWLLGYLPTNNYQASVTVYRLTPGEPASAGGAILPCP